MTADETAGRAWLSEHLGCDAGTLDRLSRFAAALRLENQRQNLVARTTLDRLWWRHIVDSAQLLRVSRETPPGPWLDLGTGAGFPGLVVAILEPARSVTLVEERKRRSEWLAAVAADLALDRVTVAGTALARLATFPAAVISARAFAPLPKLLHEAARFSTPQTLWLLPKGEKARQELADLPRKLRPMFHVEPSVTDPRAGIIVGHGLVSATFGARPC